MKIYYPSGSAAAAGITKGLAAENVALDQLSQDRSQNPLERYRALKKAQQAQRPQRPSAWYSR